MQRECTINIVRDKELVKIEVFGDLTSSAEKLMEDAYQKACSYNAKKILIKFDGKGRINSAGIAIMINLVIKSQEGECKIYITGVSKHFRKIFELVGLTKYTTVVESEDEVREYE